MSIQHVYPLGGRGHDTDSFDCTCVPSFYVPCPCCCEGGCSVCDHGWVETPVIAPDEQVAIIVHQYRKPDWQQS